MQSRICREFDVGFSLKSWDVERLIQILGGDEKVTQVCVDLADGSGHVLEETNQMLDLENSDSRPIEGISVESSPPRFLQNEGEPVRSAFVTIRDRSVGSVRYHVSGEELAVIPLARELDEWIEGITPWYSGLATAGPFKFLLGSVFLLLGLGGLVAVLQILLAGGLGGLPKAPPLPWATLTAAGTLGALYLLGVWINLKRSRIFPRASFQVGGGRVRYLQARALRRMVGWGGLAAYSATIVAVVAGSLL